MSELSSVVIRSKPEWFEMTAPGNPNHLFGYGREITSAAIAQVKANIFELMAMSADFVHRHNVSEETYWIQEDSCLVEFWLDGNVVIAEPGERVIIAPGAWHATRPVSQATGSSSSHILVVASPPFSEKDQEFMASQPEGWLE